MHAALTVVPATSTAISFPLVLTVALAIVALVGIALHVRLARRSGRLTGVSAAASGVSAAGIIVSALLVLVSLGGASTASAAPAAPSSPSSVVSPAVQPAATDDLSGYQLPTK